jgi:hypothetical protein
MLSKIIKNCKAKIRPYEKDILLASTIILVGLIGFGLGRLSKIRENRKPITIENLGAIGAVSNISQSSSAGSLVASKNGTKYHFPWCSGAQRIKDANKIWFSTREEAESAGYTPASNCKGL